MSQEQNSLYPHEWAAIACLVIMLSLLIKFSINAPDSRWPEVHGKRISPPKAQVAVTIEGSVANPGRYIFEEGTTLRAALSEAEILPSADVKKIDLDKPLRPGQKVKIPEKKGSPNKKTKKKL